jgi:hypothetical protein
MNLYYKDVNLGEIKDNYVVDGMWLYGEIFPNDNLEIFREFLKALVDEDHDFQEDHYDEDWLNEENWFITDKDGVKKGIIVPAVYEDGAINWRWR